MKLIYTLYTCDEWKSTSSMNCVLATTSWKKLCKSILDKFKFNAEWLSNEDIKDVFKIKNKKDAVCALNNNLANVFIAYWED